MFLPRNHMRFNKEGSDINTATFAQRTVAAYLEMGELSDHIAALRQAYRLRRDTMLRAVTASFPKGTCCYRPSNGMFLWVELPRAIDMVKMLRASVAQKKVAFVPGQAFSVVENDAVNRSMRLKFSHCDPEFIMRGITHLGELLSE